MFFANVLLRRSADILASIVAAGVGSEAVRAGNENGDGDKSSQGQRMAAASEQQFVRGKSGAESIGYH